MRGQELKESMAANTQASGWIPGFLNGVFGGLITLKRKAGGGVG